MNRFGDDFLARAAFAGNQNGDIAGRNAFDGAHDLLHLRTLKDGRGTATHGGQRAAE